MAVSLHTNSPASHLPPQAPKSVYPNGAPPVSPAVACTMNLCFQYFAIYLGIAVLQTCPASRGRLKLRLGCFAALKYFFVCCNAL